MPIIAPLSRPALLALSNGMVFRGIAIGAPGLTTGYLTFHTNMTGYQEILTTPASYGQIVSLTYPMIGNVGVNEEDSESKQIWAAGLVIRQLPTKSSNWRKQAELTTFLEQSNVVGITGIDTRELTNVVRNEGILGACIVAAAHVNETLNEDHAIEQAKQFAGFEGRDLTQEVGTKESYEWTEGEWTFGGFDQPDTTTGHLCLIDLGTRKALLRAFAQRGYKISVLPPTTTAEEILKYSPDGVIFSDGPGDPAACQQVIEMAKSIISQNVPVLGVGIGHQILAIAAGAKTLPLKVGHHGVNHPVEHVLEGFSAMSQQNQRYVVDKTSIPSDIEIAQLSLFDESVQGLRWKNRPIMTTQGYPDALSAPRGTVHLFDRFVEAMQA